MQVTAHQQFACWGITILIFRWKYVWKWRNKEQMKSSLKRVDINAEIDIIPNKIDIYLGWKMSMNMNLWWLSSSQDFQKRKTWLTKFIITRAVKIRDLYSFCRYKLPHMWPKPLHMIPFDNIFQVQSSNSSFQWRGTETNQPITST